MSNHIVDVNKKVSKWDTEGNPLNLHAAAEDAYEWMVFYAKRSSQPSERFLAARDELRKFLDE